MVGLAHSYGLIVTKNSGGPSGLLKSSRPAFALSQYNGETVCPLVKKT